MEGWTRFLHHRGRHAGVLFHDARDVVMAVTITIQVTRRLQPGDHEPGGQFRRPADKVATVVQGGDLHAVDEIFAQPHNLTPLLGQSGERLAPQPRPNGALWPRPRKTRENFPPPPPLARRPPAPPGRRLHPELR